LLLMSEILKLPGEVITRIIFHLDDAFRVEEASNVRLVNKEFYRLFNEDTLWDLFIQRDYPFYFDTVNIKNQEKVKSKEAYLRHLGCQISNGLKIELTADKSFLNYAEEVTLTTTLTNVGNTTIQVRVGYSTGGVYLQNGSAYLLSFQPSNDAKKRKYSYEGHGYCGTGAYPYHAELTPNEKITYSVCGKLKGRSGNEPHRYAYEKKAKVPEEKPKIINQLLLDFGRGYVLPINKPQKKDSEPVSKKPKTTSEIDDETPKSIKTVPVVQKIFIQSKLQISEDTPGYYNYRTGSNYLLNRTSEDRSKKDNVKVWIGESLSNFIPLTLDISQSSINL